MKYRALYPLKAIYKLKVVFPFIVSVAVYSSHYQTGEVRPSTNRIFSKLPPAVSIKVCRFQTGVEGRERREVAL